MAQIYARIGIATGNKEASARAVELLENELSLFGNRAVVKSQIDCPFVRVHPEDSLWIQRA